MLGHHQQSIGRKIMAKVRRTGFGTWEKKTTPSGMWDNGLYVEGAGMTIPVDVLENSIITEVKLKVGTYPLVQKKAWRITVGNDSWLVDYDPNKVIQKYEKVG
jgi:hypothetical protein